MRNIVRELVFKSRIRDETIRGENPYKWKDKSSEEYFKDLKQLQKGSYGAIKYNRKIRHTIKR